MHPAQAFPAAPTLGYAGPAGQTPAQVQTGSVVWEHGALIVSKSGNFSIPAYPLEEVIDPTGAGDTFAGGIMGYLASGGEVSKSALRRAVAYGSGSLRLVRTTTVSRWSGKRTITLRKLTVSPECHCVRWPRCSL